MYYKSLSYRLFNYLNIIFIGILAFLCVAPLLHILAMSFSSRDAALANMVGLWPVGFTLEPYITTLKDGRILTSLWNSLERLALGVSFDMVITILAAYPLSKMDNVFKGRTFFVWFFIFTMLFHGGLIPEYILVQKLGLMDSVWALILPKAANVFNMILLIHFFNTVPKSLEESAYVDGAGHFKTLLYIYIPISMPVIATVLLFSIVFHWNQWFDGLIYLTEQKDYPMSTLLHTLLSTTIDQQAVVGQEKIANITDRTVNASQIILGTLPIIFVYPFLQKYFVTGIKLGAVKE